MESVTFDCKGCELTIGTFTNQWTQIGKTYFSPKVDPPHDPVIKVQGALRAGDRGTLVEGCQLQDISCDCCGAVLGIRCISSPVNHVLDENQNLFRRSTVEAYPENSPGSDVHLVVKRHLKLREIARVSTDGVSDGFHAEASTAAGAAELSLLHAELEAQRGDIERIDSAGFKVISGLDDAVHRVEGDLVKMRDTLSVLRQELRGSHEDMASLKSEIKEVKKEAQDRTLVTRLQEQISSTTGTVDTMRQGINDLATRFEQELDSVKAGQRQNTKAIDDIKSLVKDRVSARDHAKDMAALRAELTQLRKQMDESRPQPPGPFPSRELDILTSNISKIGNRANQVESLQMEFEIFKGRLERMEAAAATQASQARQIPSASADTVSAYDRYNDHDYRQEELRTSRRKRPSSGPDASSPTESSKRLAPSSDPADTIMATQWSEHPQSSPLPEVRTRAEATRLTKSGKVDKRTQRSARRSLNGINLDDKLLHSKRRG